MRGFCQKCGFYQRIIDGLCWWCFIIAEQAGAVRVPLPIERKQQKGLT